MHKSYHTYISTRVLTFYDYVKSDDYVSFVSFELYLSPSKLNQFLQRKIVNGFISEREKLQTGSYSV